MKPRKSVPKPKITRKPRLARKTAAKPSGGFSIAELAGAAANSNAEVQDMSLEKALRINALRRQEYVLKGVAGISFLAALVVQMSVPEWPLLTQMLIVLTAAGLTFVVSR